MWWWLLACGEDPAVDRLPDAFVGEVARIDGRAAWSERTGPLASAVVAEEGGARRVLVSGGTPDRVALSPDGERVAFVWAPDGIASVWVVPFAGGEPVRVTNAGVAGRKHAPGVPPEGFVPPPDGPPRFEGDRLVWDGPAGPIAVELP